jgi:UPF0716 protein FxsA
VGPLIAVLFLGIPILEIYVLIQVGQAIGIGWTLLLLIADAVFGAWLVRREGRRAWRSLQASLREAPRTGRVPAREVLDGALVLVGGTLLMTPGFVTDIAGLLCVLPLTRPLVRAFVVRRFTGRVRVIQQRPASPDVPRVIEPD